MNNAPEHAPLLIFAYGNPSRGDDALGPLIYEHLLNDRHRNKHRHANADKNGTQKVDLLTDYQLQIEHALDLEQREAILFVDASSSCTSAYELRRIAPEADNSYTTHAMTPAAVLEVYQQINQRPPPPAWMLTVRGYEFSLGKALSERARHNLRASYHFIDELLHTETKNWPRYKTADSAYGQNRRKP